MKKTILWLLCAALLLCGCAAAESAQKAPDFIMEGYDGDSAGHNWDENLFFSRMQEKTGISFQFRQYSDWSKWAERKELIGQGEDLPDVLFKAGLTAGEVRDWYGAGILVDLRPYLEEYAPDLWALLSAREDRLKAVSMPDGAIPALPAINELQNNDILWINTEWLGRLNLQKPTTAQELTETLRAFRDGDPNRNGQADEVPLTFIGMWELRFLGHAFGIIDNDYYVTLRDGEVTSSLTSDENRAFLAWLHELWQERLIDRQGFNMNDTMRQITDEKKAIPYGALLSTTPLTVVPGASLGAYETLGPLTWNGKQVYRDLLGEVIRGTFAITRECREPEKLLAWVNTLYTEEGSRLAQCGAEGEEYTWNEDGYWEWNVDLNTVANEVLPGHTIAEGGSAPGWTGADFQLKYSDEATRENIRMLYEYRKYVQMPYPLITFSAEDEKRVAELQKGISDYAETAMAAFVTGETELNDQNWESFRKTLQEKGLEEQIAIFRKYAQ